MEGFLKSSFEEYCANPLGASLQIFKHVADLSKQWKEEADNRARDAEKERDEERARSGEARKMLEPTSAALNKARQDLLELKKEKQQVENDRDSAANKAKDLEVRLKEAESKVKETAESKSGFANVLYLIPESVGNLG